MKRKGKTKKVTKMEIIRCMLLEELKSPTQYKYIPGNHLRSEFDLCTTDEAKLNFAMNKLAKWRALTPKAYALMVSYKNRSVNRAKEYAEYFKWKAKEAVFESDVPRFLELHDECNNVYNAVNAQYERMSKRKTRK